MRLLRVLVLIPTIVAVAGWANHEVRLEGRVLESGSDEGVAGASVRLVRAGIRTETDEEGRFDLGSPDIAPDTLLVFHRDYGQVVIPLGSLDGDLGMFDIVIRPAAIQLDREGRQ